MPAEIVTHLARRAVRVGVKCMEKMAQHQPAPGDAREAMENLLERLRSPQSIITFSITAIIFLILTSAIEYAIRIVAVNVAIVEDTQPTGAIKLPLGVEDDITKAPLLEDYDGAVEERAGQPAKPITSSIRGTFRHLSSIGGFCSRWRGLVMGVFYSVAFSLFHVIFASFLGFMPILGLVVARLAAAAVTCNLHAAWTHATIAMPANKPFFQRFLPRTSARHLVLPTIRLHVGLMAMQFGSAGAAALSHSIIASHGLNWLTVNSAVLPIVVFLAVALAHVVPAQIALVRAEASLLPEDRSAVVPFDRTFGGRVAWEGFSCRRAYFFRNMTVRGAYMTFDKPTYKRVLKMLVKCFTILTAITVVFFGIAVVEFYALAGKEAHDAMQYGMTWNF